MRDDLLSTISAFLDGDQFVLGPNVAGFEQEFAAYVGTDHAIGVANGTDAITLALIALGIGAGDEVITVAHTALATIAGIVRSGATPVLIDVDDISMTMDPAQIERHISPRTRAVMPVHLYGHPADLEAIVAICRDHQLALIEDCSQAHGAKAQVDGALANVGSIGVIGVFSCYPTKNLGALGDAGIITTNDASISARLKRLRQYGWDEQLISREPGMNSRLDELQASILRMKLKSLESMTLARQAIAHRYDSGLGDSAVQLPRRIGDQRHVYHLYVVQTTDRDALRAQLTEQGIGTGIHYARSAHQHPGYADLCRFTGLSTTERLCDTVLSLPMYPELTDEQVDRVIAAVRSCA